MSKMSAPQWAIESLNSHSPTIKTLFTGLQCRSQHRRGVHSTNQSETECEKCPPLSGLSSLLTVILRQLKLYLLASNVAANTAGGCIQQFSLNRLIRPSYTFCILQFSSLCRRHHTQYGQYALTSTCGRGI